MSDPVNLSSTSEELHTAEVMRLTEKLEALSKKHAQLNAAYNKLGDEGLDLDIEYLQMSATPELQTQNAEKLDQMARQLHGMQTRLDSMYHEIETSLSEMEQTRKTLRELNLKPDDSFRLEKEEDLGIDFEALEDIAKDAEWELNATTRKFKNKWDGWDTPEAMLDGQVQGQKNIMKSWQGEWAKYESREKDLLDRREKLGSNVLKKVWNWREISKIDNQIKKAPDWRKGYGDAMKETEKDIQKAERARERFHKNVAQMKEQKAEESLAKAQKSEVALKGEEDLGIDFQSLSKIGKESEGMLNQVKGENELSRLTGELERLKKGQGTMERAFQHVDDNWDDLKNQRKQLSGDPISRFRNKEKLKEIDNELEVVMPQWYALQDGKIKYQAEIAKTEQAIEKCQNDLGLGQQQQQSQHQKVGEVTHLSHGAHGTKSQGIDQPSKEVTGPGKHNVGTDLHLNHNGHGDKSEGPKLSPTNPYAQHVHGPKR
jgi:chromosome segregation ATPase